MLSQKVLKGIFEQQQERPNTVWEFIQKFLLYLGLSALFIFSALLIGVIGYHWIAGLNWVDSLLNASMILGGMGPVDSLSTTSAKVFASMYALFCGLIFVLAMGIVLTPMVQMVLSKLKINVKDLGQ